MTDYIGNALSVGSIVCAGWKTAAQTKRVGTITSDSDTTYAIVTFSDGTRAIRWTDLLERAS